MWRVKVASVTRRIDIVLLGERGAQA